MQFVDIEVPGGPKREYEVVIGVRLADGVADDLVRWQPQRRWAILTDSVVGPLYGEPLAESLRAMGAAADCLTFAAGEEAKTRDTVSDLQDRLIALGHDRDSWLVAVGGGVVGDVGGFVAATLFRGIAYVQVPTTLLAMVDSSVGGKTGVDTPAGKNLVGAFLQPRRVVADLESLRTLPTAELAAGLAEVIKYGVILDVDLFEQLEGDLMPAALACDTAALAHLVSRCCDLKAAVVAADETEAGYRQILNFGHTVAHAIEAVREYDIRHGDAVAIGMVVEARLAELRLPATDPFADRIAAVCRRAGLPTEVPDGCDLDALIAAARRDKKARGGKIRCALPSMLGAMTPHDGEYGIDIDVEMFAAALRARV